MPAQDHHIGACTCARAKSQCRHTIVYCTTLKGIANFVVQDACLGDENLSRVQRLANTLLAIQATCIVNRKQEGIMIFFLVVLNTVQVLCVVGQYTILCGDLLSA